MIGRSEKEVGITSPSYHPSREHRSQPEPDPNPKADPDPHPHPHPHPKQVGITMSSSDTGIAHKARELLHDLT